MISKVAKEIAKKAHAGDVDRAGVDYFYGHLTTVVKGVKGELEKAVAYLHDAIEDTAMTYETLVNELVAGGVSKLDAIKIADGVEAMTKRAGESYDAYLMRVKRNKLARVVKLSDLAHNSDLNRLKTVGPEDLKRVEKYKTAINYLK